MAVRVRKFAKQARRSPADILGILHAIGYTKYTSPEDMLTDRVADKLTKAVQSGTKPLVVQQRSVRKESKSSAQQQPKDLMSALVPGVVRQGATTPRPVEVPQPVAVRQPEPSPRIEAPSNGMPVQTLAEARRDIERLRGELEADRAMVEAERAQLEGSRQQLAERLAEVEDERAAIAAELSSLKASSSLPGGTSIAELLTARGLRGRDEFERAIAAMALAKVLRSVIPHLAVTDVVAVQAILGRGLVLVEGQAPDDLPSTLVAVQVSKDRAELPNVATLDRQIGRLSELMLLNGFRSICIAGGDPRWHRLLDRRLDSRITRRFIPAQRRLMTDRDQDCASDVVVLWNVEVESKLLGEYRKLGNTVLVEGPSLSDLVYAVEAALTE